MLGVTMYSYCSYTVSYFVMRYLHTDSTLLVTQMKLLLYITKAEIKCCKWTSVTASYFVMFLISLNIFFAYFFWILHGNTLEMKTIKQNIQNIIIFWKKIPDQNKTKDSQFCSFWNIFWWLLPNFIWKNFISKILHPTTISFA